MRFKAEINVDGREITRMYLSKMDLEALLKVSYRQLWYSVCVCVCVHVCVCVCVYMSVCACVCLSVHRCGPCLCSCGVCDPCMFGGVPSPLLPHLCVQEVQGFQSTAQVEQLLLEHGERVVDRLGTEIDQVEIKIKVGVGQF